MILYRSWTVDGALPKKNLAFLCTVYSFCQVFVKYKNTLAQGVWTCFKPIAVKWLIRVFLSAPLSDLKWPTKNILSNSFHCRSWICRAYVEYEWHHCTTWCTSQVNYILMLIRFICHAWNMVLIYSRWGDKTLYLNFLRFWFFCIILYLMAYDTTW